MTMMDRAFQERLDALSLTLLRACNRWDSCQQRNADDDRWNAYLAYRTAFDVWTAAKARLS